MQASTEPESATAAATLPDAWRVECFRRSVADDPDGAGLPAAAAELGIEGLDDARLGRGVLLPASLGREHIERIIAELLADPLLDEVRLTAPGQLPAIPAGVRRVLVARKPGVMDPVAQTIRETLARVGLARLDPAECVSTFRAWELSGPLSDESAATLARRVLGNETIEDVLLDDEGLHHGPPAAGAPHGRVEVALCEAEDARLARISDEGGLSLNLEEMTVIRDHFRAAGREPTACELETLAQTWSEHCKHKTFAGTVLYSSPGQPVRRFENLLEETIKRATEELDRPWCVSVFHDNAGIIAFDGDWDVSFKVETHNHPSAIDPYGGAGTGIGGVIRDILGVGLGARPIANTDAFFVGPSDLPAEELPRGCMHPRRILRGVVRGVRDYGNRMGIPTVNGGVWTHPGYVANPLVFAGTIGLIPRSCATKSVAAGDWIVVAGGRTGRDGIHGATFSSVELHEESETVSSAAVQIGDPITEKRVLDALLTARDRGLYRAITDCGAGGLSSAVGEMGEELGATVDLETVPLKYPGLTPEEIWISEAQERMVMAVGPERLEALVEVFSAEGVETSVIGRFEDTGRLLLRHGGEVTGELSMAFLHGGTPRPVREAVWTPPEHPDPSVPACADHGRTLLELLAMPDVASKEWIVRQYDHEVQGFSVLKPLVGVRGDGPGDGAVLKPLVDSPKALAVGCGANPRYGLLHPGRMAAAVIDEALRNVVCVGGDPEHTAILDNFAWGNCDKPDRLGSLVLAAEACRDAALAYGTPFISGKDSLNNEYRVGGRAIPIPPTLLISALAVVPDVARVVSMDLKRAGNGVWLVGATHAELGGSHYLAARGLEGGVVPAPDLATAPGVLRALHGALAAGCVRACHDLSEGGLAVAAAEMAFAGELGLTLELSAVEALEAPPGADLDATLLYSESTTRFLVEVEPAAEERWLAAMAGVPCARVGRVLAEPQLEIEGLGGGRLACIALADLRAAHGGGFQG
ncbi:MAG: phosphoribosylformylglycinamidine synthase subunit PurL [Planctomycetota bacterium]|jgi:phosphoribosylformylglycinamidine synthase|nr:phosphoribosylformylglycinamidine synthase subunit PurL [Planctomycetota bacterium]